MNVQFEKFTAWYSKNRENVSTQPSTCMKNEDTIVTERLALRE